MWTWPWGYDGRRPVLRCLSPENSNSGMARVTIDRIWWREGLGVWWRWCSMKSGQWHAGKWQKCSRYWWNHQRQMWPRRGLLLVLKSRPWQGKDFWVVGIIRGGSPHQIMPQKMVATVETDKQSIVSRCDCGGCGAKGGSWSIVGREVVIVVVVWLLESGRQLAAGGWKWRWFKG